jgi:hypothetical protein
MDDEQHDFTGWYDSTPDVKYGEQHTADQEAIAKQLASPKAVLKRMWEHIEMMPLDRSAQAHSLWTVSMALITLIHAENA